MFLSFSSIAFPFNGKSLFLRRTHFNRKPIKRSLALKRSKLIAVLKLVLVHNYYINARELCQESANLCTQIKNRAFPFSIIVTPCALLSVLFATPPVLPIGPSILLVLHVIFCTHASYSAAPSSALYTPHGAFRTLRASSAP